MKKIKKIGLLTGGGDCPGLNAAIRAVVDTACLKYDMTVWGIQDGFSGLVDKKIKKIEPKDVSGILPLGGTILGTSNRDNPFKYPFRQKDGMKLYIDASDKVKETFDGLDLDALVVIGGDGTQTISNQIYEKYGIPLIGIPKTIDNDIGGTDQTIGFDTALATATEAIDKLHSTAESHHRIMVIEVMGRYAGWIALFSGMAGGGDVILIPEIPFQMDRIIGKIEDRIKKGKRFSLVVVAEGARPQGGQLSVNRQVDDPNDSIRLGGISRWVGQQIETITQIETRYTILGHIQRGGSPTHFDRILATRFGYQAVEALINNKYAQLVGLYGQDIIFTPIKEAVALPRRIQPDSDLIHTAKAVGTCFGI